MIIYYVLSINKLLIFCQFLRLSQFTVLFYYAIIHISVKENTIGLLIFGGFTMEELLRGYVYNDDGHTSVYFENTVDNIATFIYDNAHNAQKIVVESLFGKELLNFDGSGITGNNKYLSKVINTLESLKNGTVSKSSVKFLDLQDMNNRDEFDSKDVDEKDLIKLYDGH